MSGFSRFSSSYKSSPFSTGKRIHKLSVALGADSRLPRVATNTLRTKKGPAYFSGYGKMGTF